jgi:hypothetical protein
LIFLQIINQYNEKIKSNELLRKEIDHLKVLARKSTKILNKLKKDLKEAENELKFLSEKHKNAFEQRLTVFT